MKIALISPRGNLSKNKILENFWKASLETYGFRKSLTGFSSGLLIVAALTPKEHSIKFIDENFDILDFKEDYDLVAITAMTQQAVRAYEIADVFRERKIKVIIGGIHASVLPYEAKQHADSVVIGEAENTWLQILEDFKNDKLKFFYKSNFPADLNNTPLPRYDLVNKENYKVIWIQTSRGCPIDCEFCSASKVFGYKLRHKKIDQVVKEIRFVKSIWDTPQISFADDNIFIDKKYAIGLLKALKALKIRWFAQADISIAENDEFLRLLSESGCAILFIGFESINKKSLIHTDNSGFKYRRVSSYKEYIKKIQNYGIGIMGAFIVGFDKDNESVFKRTANFIVDNKLYAAQITALTPLPGTRLRKRMEEENRLLPNSWENYTFLDVNFRPKLMSPEKLQKGLFQIYRKVYSSASAVKRAKYFKEVYRFKTKEN